MNGWILCRKLCSSLQLATRHASCWWVGGWIPQWWRGGVWDQLCGRGGRIFLDLVKLRFWTMYTQSISISMTMLIDTGENTNSYSLRHHESWRPVQSAQAIIDAQISILSSISLLVSMLGVGPEMFKYLENQINSYNWLCLIKWHCNIRHM